MGRNSSEAISTFKPDDESELNLIIENPTLYSETTTIQIWRMYIDSMKKEGDKCYFEALEKMIMSYREIDIFN
jgi:hypothetical protein